ncbi:glutamate receptor ionotropic, delta-2-like [Vespa crabro]|uniref:glutamate receptor ionotropic, delta-2-like n=1 Tax=Vespa crabro TaxID=7445 RepID=UPI001F0222CF|nr:glutamate receptor ionotropic, delta-2-like [Vespa crabro]
MSFAAWLVLFIYKGHGSDYCHSPPGNIFHLRYNSNMLVRCGTENILREWYSIDMNRTEINDLATWSLENGITKIASDFLYKRRSNLQGLVMRAVIVKDSSFLIVNEDGKLDGILGRILRNLCVTLNFSINIVSEVEEYGNWNSKEKTWSGAVGELYAGRADISIADFTITGPRLNVVDFTLPLLLTKKCLYIREPQIFAIKWSSFILAFSYSIWIAILMILIVGSILLIFLKIKNGSDRKIRDLLSDNFLEIWGIFCQQGLADPL